MRQSRLFRYSGAARIVIAVWDGGDAEESKANAASAGDRDSSTVSAFPSSSCHPTQGLLIFHTYRTISAVSLNTSRLLSVFRRSDTRTGQQTTWPCLTSTTLTGRVASLELLPGMSHCLTAIVTDGSSNGRQEWHEHSRGRCGRNWFWRSERGMQPDHGKRSPASWRSSLQSADIIESPPSESSTAPRVPRRINVGHRRPRIYDEAARQALIVLWEGFRPRMRQTTQGIVPDTRSSA